MTSVYSECKKMASDLVQLSGEVKFNQQLCKLLAERYKSSLNDLDGEIEARPENSCPKALAELCRVMCCGKRLAEEWTSEDWWKSMANSANSVSVGKKVEIHLKEFLSCVKVLRIAIAEAKCNFKFDLSTIKDSEVLMSVVFKGYEKTHLEHIDACMQKFTSSEDCELAKHLKERFTGQLSIKFADVKITDFGLSKLKEGSQYSTLDVGTRAFMAPEVFNVEDNKDKNYTTAADVYSYAMIFFEVLTGKVPFEGVPRSKIFQIIKKGERPNLPSEAYCPEYLSAFIRRCWATEAKERPEFPDICQMLVYCKELILRDSVPFPLICIVENDAQKLSSFLGPKFCIEKVYSFMVFIHCM